MPTPRDVPVLWLGTAERISAIVEMKHPGVWVMGDLADDDRNHGMGIVVEYAGRNGDRRMGQAAAVSLGLRAVRHSRRDARAPDETIEMTIVKHNAAAHGFNRVDAQRRGVLA